MSRCSSSSLTTTRETAMNTALAEVFPAGQHLADELEARGWTQTEFAEILARPAQFVSEIISGKKEITRDSAAQIGAALGTSAEMWLNLQDQYFLWKQSKDKATQDELDEVRLRARLNDLAPMSVLRKRGIVSATTTAGQVAEVKRLFRLDDIMDEPCWQQIAARRGNVAEPLSPGQITWLACVEQALPDTPKAAYSETGLEALAKRVTQVVREPEGLGALPQAYAEVGVRLVYVEAFPSSKISGASFLHENAPVIALSGLRQRLDIVLFTLLHETAHIVQGDLAKSEGVPIIDDEDSPVTLGDEAAADALAASWVLPEKIPSPPARVNKEWVNEVAASMDVHPIVLIGRLQKSGAVPWRTSLVKDAPTAPRFLQAW